MLQIYLYGPRENGFLDLPPNTRLDMESIAEMFDEQLAIGEYNIPLDIPWTETNLRLTGYANRPQNQANGGQYQFVADVYDNGFPEIQRGKFTILGTRGSFSPGSGTMSITVSGAKGVFGNTVRSKKLKDLQLGGTITFTETSSREFATNVMKGMYPQYSYIRFAPVCRRNYIDVDRPDHDGEFLVGDRVNYLVYTGAAPDGWEFGRPDPSNATIAIAEGNALFKDFRTIPFFSLKYVFRKCFEEFGYSISGTIMNTSVFDDVCLDNNFSIENYGGNYDLNRTIIPANHMPDTGIRDFIIAVCQWLNVYPVFSGQKVELKQRTGTLNGTRLFDITPYVRDSFEAEREAEEVKKSVNFGYASDGTDNAMGDAIKDLIGKTIVATVMTLGELATLDIGRPLTTNDIALVMNENMYFQVADSTGSPILWDAYSDALQPVISDAEQETTELPLAPLTTQVELNSTTQLYMNMLACCIDQRGSYSNNKGIRVKHDFGLRTMYISLRSAGSYTVPGSYYHHLDENGDQIQPYSLALDGEFGIVKNFHKEWALKRSRGLIIKTSIKCNSAVLSEIKKADKLIIQDVQYLLYQIERTIPLDEFIDLQLLPL